MKPEMWVALSIFILLVLVYIGIRPLLPSWHQKKENMPLEEFGKWLHTQTKNTNHFVDIMSGELPPKVYDPIADILFERPEIKTRILTERTVLCNHINKNNKMVDQVFNGQMPNVELRTADSLPTNHIKIFDRKIAWVEDEHPHGDMQDYRQGCIINDPIKVSVYVSDFEWYWKRATHKRPICISPQRIAIG